MIEYKHKTIQGNLRLIENGQIMSEVYIAHLEEQIKQRESLSSQDVGKPFTIEWVNKYKTVSGAIRYEHCDDIPKAINDFIKENPDGIITLVE
tara:strand:+ start:76 stop:354 length:279 start_codon:yes stop_codon:yes gene_type:complete